MFKFENIFSKQSKNKDVKQKETAENIEQEEISKDVKSEDEKDEKMVEPKNDYPEELVQATLLQKIRNRSGKIKPILQILAAQSLGIGGVELGQKIADNRQEQRMEIENSGREVKRYSLENKNNKEPEFIKFLNDDAFLSEVASSMQGKDNLKYLIENKEFLLSVLNDQKFKPSKDDSKKCLEQLEKINSQIKNIEDKREDKKSLSEADRQMAQEQIIELSILIEQAKVDLIKHLESDEYLEKLAKEMNISEEAAKIHQRVRISNIKNLSYEFQSSDTISKIDTSMTGIRAYAYYSNDRIVMPYDINLKDPKEKSHFYETVLHEMGHGSTKADIGMSNKSKKVFKKSFTPDGKFEPKSFKAYYSNPEELIVRKQILDLEMEKLGIKKYGNKFTKGHYRRLLILKNKNKLSNDAIDFLNHIKAEDFPDVMNELAENSNRGETYSHPGWDYNDKSNNA